MAYVPTLEDDSPSVTLPIIHNIGTLVYFKVTNGAVNRGKVIQARIITNVTEKGVTHTVSYYLGVGGDWLPVVFLSADAAFNS